MRSSSERRSQVFWSGDDYVSEEFRDWLSRKIMGVKLTAPEISSIEPLGKVFELVYGRKYFAISTFLRVSLVAILVFFLTIIGLSGKVYAAAYFVVFYLGSNPGVSLTVFATNIVMD
jgi:hypothetical protein